MPKQASRIKRILKVIGIVIGALLALLYLGLPAAMAVYAVLPGHSVVGEPPEGFQKVSLTAADGIRLQAWYRPPENSAVIVLLHGAGSSRESLRGYAAMLAGHGYGVLAVDLRGHGESQGRTNRFSWQGTPDVGAAVNFLKERSEVQRIGGLGISVGGETLLGAASTYPEIQAIVTDGATQRCTAELLALEAERPLVRSFTARVMYAVVRLLSFEEPPLPLLQSMRAAENTRFLLIAGGSQEREIAYSQTFQEKLGERVALWVAPNVGHTAAFGIYPQEYEQRVTEFFDTVLFDLE